MQKLTLDEEEKLSRKEYLKQKKKQSKTIKLKKKWPFIVIPVILLLAIYVFIQFYIYYQNNYRMYVEDEAVKAQKVYDIYYLSAGYTYTPKSSLNRIKTNGTEDMTIYHELGFVNIIPHNDYIYGMKEDTLSKLNKETNEVSMVYQGDIKKYTMYGNEIYAIVGSTNKLIKIDATTNDVLDLAIENVTEILVDENNIFVVIPELTKKVLVKLNKDGSGKVNLTHNENVSYIIQNENRIFFVNKADENRIYLIQKDGTGTGRVADIKTVSDNGDIQDVDGSKYMFLYQNTLYFINTSAGRNLWKVNLEDRVPEEVIGMNMDILEVVDNTVIYKETNEKGVYLFNLDTKFLSQISSRLITEFVVNR